MRDDEQNTAERAYRSRLAAQILEGISEQWHPNLSLLFERFPRALPRPPSTGWRQEALRYFRDKSTFESPLLQRAHARLAAACRALGGQERVFATASRLAIGLGNQSPTENGLALDWHTGLPFIPGSSLKGLARAGAELQLSNPDSPPTQENEEQLRDQIERLLGRAESPRPFAVATQTEEERGARRGLVAFLDALPAQWPPGQDSRDQPGFELDVTTRHHDIDDVNRAREPLDANEPNPVHFLVVSSQVRFILRLIPLGPLTDDDWRTVWNWLEQAMSHLGVGAKTAVGYGHMVPEQSPQRTPQSTPKSG